MMLKLLSLLAIAAVASALSPQLNRHYRQASLASPAVAKSGVATPAAAATWSVDVGKPVVSISPDLFGIFFEEINHAGDGGLYAEQIQNSNFEDNRGVVYPWTAIKSGNTNYVLVLDSEVPLNGHQPTSLQVITSGVPAGTQVGISNPGFWGINTVGISGFDVVFYAYSKTITSVTVTLTSKDGSSTYASQTLTGVAAGWKKFSTSFSLSGVSDPGAVFNFNWNTVGSTDRINFDVVSVLPQTSWNGLSFIRPDLGNMVAAMKPAFMRFPGGCFVEGQVIANRFNWKKALGNMEDRTGQWSLWGYYSSLGLGLFEYLSFIEQLTDPYGNPTRAIWVVNNGVSHEESIDPSMIQPYIQDTLDSVEFAQGDVSTYWGSVRASMGHPAPFHIDYIAIGNEDCGKTDYAANYALFYTALSNAYPNIKLISNCDPSQLSPVQLFDYHIYTSSADLIKGQTTFDAPSYHSSSSRVFNSEYAVTSDAGNGNMIAAVAEAAWMIGLERNGDVVSAASYAPLFVNANDRKWTPDAIVFNSSAVYGTPSYWNQVLFGNSFNGVSSGSVQTLTNTLDGATDVSVIASTGKLTAGGTVIVHKIANYGANSADISVTISNAPSLKASADVTQISATSPTAENSFADPTLVSPSMSTLTVSNAAFSITVPAYSVTVIRVYSA